MHGTHLDPGRLDVKLRMGNTPQVTPWQASTAEVASTDDEHGDWTSHPWHDWSQSSWYGWSADGWDAQAWSTSGWDRRPSAGTTLRTFLFILLVYATPRSAMTFFHENKYSPRTISEACWPDEAPGPKLLAVVLRRYAEEWW